MTESTHSGAGAATVAKVAATWRYPVKSMRGQRVACVDVDERGVDGDRRYAVRDAAGRIASGKRTRRFGKVDGLLRFQAKYEGPLLEIVFPDGSLVREDSHGLDAALSHLLGQSVTLVREADESHMDDAPIHLLTTASLAWLRGLLPDAAIDERRFRPNLLLDVPGTDRVEDAWVGRELRIGESLRVRVTQRTERCAMTVLEQDDLPRDPRVLKRISHEADLCLGVYARVLAPGRVRIGDSVTVASD